MVKKAIRKADVLIEALPYIRRFNKKVFVIKYGGSILCEEKVRRAVFEDIAFLRYAGIRPVLVHGGGPRISERLREEKLPVKFVDGLRVTDASTLKIVEEELDKLNQTIVKELINQGISAKGFSVNNPILQVVQKKASQDLGRVGEIVDFKGDILKAALKESVPVIAPIGVCKEKKTYNINADDAAFFLAAELKAEKLILLTKVLGVMRNIKDDSSLISTITADEIDKLISNKVINEGMVPKVRAALKALKAGVGKAHIVDAKIPHAFLLEIFTNKGIGTEII
ncbi:MAG: acetylglutamate kinase [Candidatus Omnitrophota bacterium]